MYKQHTLELIDFFSHNKAADNDGLQHALRSRTWLYAASIIILRRKQLPRQMKTKNAKKKNERIKAVRYLHAGHAHVRTEIVGMQRTSAQLGSARQ